MCFAGPHFPWSPPFAPPAPLRPSLQTPPQWISSLCSPASQLLWRGPTSRVRASSATAPHLPDADRRTRHTARDDGGQTRDLPGSDTIVLHSTCLYTRAAGQHYAWRCRTCCLRANENPRPLRYLIFRGSIPHPRQSLCTLRNHRRQWPRNTRYQAGRYPLTWAGLSPAGSHQLCLAHSFDHLVGEGEQLWRNVDAERLGGVEIDHQSELGGLNDRHLRRVGATSQLSKVHGLPVGSQRR